MFEHLFHVIASEALGNKNSSWETIGSLLPSSSFGQAKQNLFVNAATGNLVVEDHSKVILDFDFKLHVGMIYNSQTVSPNQPWRLSLGKSLILNSENLAKDSITESYDIDYTYVENTHYLKNIQQADTTTLTFEYQPKKTRVFIKLCQLQFINVTGLQNINLIGK